MSNEKNLESLFASSVMEEATAKIKESISKKLNELETDLESKITKISNKADKRIEQLESKVQNIPSSINLGSIEKPKEMLVHMAFDTIIKVLQSSKRINKNIMLVGPAGSSKTTTCAQVAEVLNLQFYPMSVGLQTTKSDLMGFLNVKGEYVTTPVREAFEKGGVLLLDEFDASHAGVVTILNSLLANEICSFPDKTVEKHKDFICIVACNTYGKGGSIDYIGRNRLDGATLDRFITILVDYDTNLESQLVKNPTWLKVINKMRDNIVKNGLKMIVSPRASMQGADLLDAGFKVEEVLEMVIYKGISNDVKTKLIQGIDFGEFNKTDVEPENPKNKQRRIDKTLPISIDIDFDIGCYSVKNIEESVSICSSVDWEGFLNIYISSGSEWFTDINTSDVFLNFGNKNVFNIKPIRKNIINFINQLDTYGDTIKLDSQYLDLTIVFNNEIKKYMLG